MQGPPNEPQNLITRPIFRVFLTNEPQKWIKRPSFFLTNEPQDLIKRPIFTGLFHHWIKGLFLQGFFLTNEPQNRTFYTKTLESRENCRKKWGRTLGQNGVHFKKRWVTPPPFSGRGGRSTKKKGVHFRETLFVVGFIFGTFRETTEFFIR